MIDQQHCTAAMNLVAIDVAKDWNMILVQDVMGQRQSFRVANRAADHKQFVEFLQALPGRVRVALEPTGDYHRPLAYRLLQEGFEVVSVSSVAQARFREARYGTWDKNDPKDAQVILAMLEHGLVQTYYDPLWQGTHDWQELANTYFQITLTRTRLQHSLLLPSTYTHPAQPGAQELAVSNVTQRYGRIFPVKAVTWPIPTTLFQRRTKGDKRKKVPANLRPPAFRSRTPGAARAAAAADCRGSWY